VGGRAQARGGARQLTAGAAAPSPTRSLDGLGWTNVHPRADIAPPQSTIIVRSLSGAARRSFVSSPDDRGTRERRYRRCLPRTSSARSNAGSRSCSAKRRIGAWRREYAARSRPRWPCAGAPCASGRCSPADQSHPHPRTPRFSTGAFGLSSHTQCPARRHAGRARVPPSIDPPSAPVSGSIPARRIPSDHRGVNHSQGLPRLRSRPP
jgi:hypothetical protein